MSNQRDHFRLNYPKPDRPQVLIAGHKYEVIDLSERGLKFLRSKTFQLTTDAAINATIYFHDGKSCAVRGKVLRVTENTEECVLILSDGVPLPKMMEEQRYLLQKYKT